MRSARWPVGGQEGAGVVDGLLCGRDHPEPRHETVDHAGIAHQLRGDAGGSDLTQSYEDRASLREAEQTNAAAEGGVTRVCEHPQVVASAAAWMEVRRFECRTHYPHGVGQILVLVITDERDSRGGSYEAEEHPHRRRLAGTIGTEEAGDAPGLDGEREPVDGRECPESLRQVPDVKRDSEDGSGGRGR